MDLNPEQQIAATHVEGPLLVLAGAGSGKTRIVTSRIAHLIEMGVSPSEILAVTFTNKAAEEMRHRIHAAAKQYVLASTFHSLCARILRESITPLGYTSDFVIYDQDDSLKLIKVCYKTLSRKEEKGEAKKMQNAISQAKNALILPEVLDDEEPLFKEIYTLYQAKLREYNALDFDDLLLLTVQLFKRFPEVLAHYQRRWRFLLIDEYQDTNPAQDAIAKLLVSSHRNLFAVGDPDQSIYSWRGAEINNILEFQKSFPEAKVVSLEQNYRSRDNILQAANALISKNVSRYEKKLWSALGEGEPIHLMIAESDREEASFIVDKLREYKRKGTAYKESVIFYRTNFQSRVIEDALLRSNVPYQIIGGLSFYQRREVKDILAYLRLVLSDCDYLSFARVINTPKRGFGEVALTKLRLLAEDKCTSILTACREAIEPRSSCKLSTKQRTALQEFLHMIDALRARASSAMALHEFIGEAVEYSGYLRYLKEDPETYEERRSNLAELTSKAAEWESEGDVIPLSTFLEELSLKSATDEIAIDDDSVRLMTLHNGKGLEFTTVFLSGMEEDLFPHINARDSEANIEEERRLAYVGMTRAKEHLFLTASRFRYLWGSPRIMRPSRFLKEIPQEFLKAQNMRFTEDTPIIDASDDEFYIGDSVKHNTFGVGTIQNISETSLGTTYEVFFPDEGISRTLVAKYAKLSSV